MDTILRVEHLCDTGQLYYSSTELGHISETTQTPDSNVVKDWRISHETGEYLHNLILKRKPARVLELGTSTGYSALWIGSALATYGGHLDTVEYFDLKIPIANRFVHEAELDEVVTVHHMRIKEFLKNAAHNQIPLNPSSLSPHRGGIPKYDMVFMDADKTNYLEYWNLMQPLLNPHCVVIADNATNFSHSMQPWTDHCTNDPNLSCELVRIGTGLFTVQKQLINPSPSYSVVDK
jgi:predicted O-methyltransferase YrrM